MPTTIFILIESLSAFPNIIFDIPGKNLLSIPTDIWISSALLFRNAYANSINSRGVRTRNLGLVGAILLIWMWGDVVKSFSASLAITLSILDSEWTSVCFSNEPSASNLIWARSRYWNNLIVDYSSSAIIPCTIPASTLSRAYWTLANLCINTTTPLNISSNS